MTDDLAELQQRIGKASDDLVAAIHDLEHALADTRSVESATAVCRVIGGCYAAFDRVNTAAIARKVHFEVTRDLESYRKPLTK